jgi:hypothetical protein
MRVSRPLLQAFQRFTPSLGGDFGVSFLQILHWLCFAVYSLHLENKAEFLQAPLLLPTHSLLSGLWLDFHQLVNDHAGRTAALTAQRDSLFPD